MSVYTTAVANAPSRRLFAPLFRARWQNAQNIVNDSAFYSMIPSKYKPYYEAYIRQWAQWSSGFVLQLHRQDFFSTGIGYTVVEILARECMTGGFRLNATDAQTKEFMERWADDENLTGAFYNMFSATNGTGNAILVLTPVNGELYLTAYPINRCFFQIGRRNTITQITLLNRFVAGEDSAYYARETRAKINGKYYYRVSIASSDLVTCPTFSNNEMENVPEVIKEQWLECYGNIKPNVWYRLPKRLRGIGCYNVKNKETAAALKDMPGYSDASIHTCLDIFYSIDYNYTQSQVDLYMGKSRALIPKQMQKVVMGTTGTLTEGKSFYDAINNYTPQLEEEFYTQIGDGLNGDAAKPMFIQPDLREQAHKYIRDSDLEFIASKIGLSASDLANHLNYNYGGTKTATQVISEDTTTEKTVNEKRRVAKNAVNKMLSDVAYFYGYECDVEVQWGRAAANSARENQELLADYQAGVLSLRDYLRKRWTDLTEEEIESKAVEIEREREKKLQSEQRQFGNALFDDKDYYGTDTQGGEKVNGGQVI
jgi:hypothetical protein